MDWMRERVQDVECRFNSCKSILDSVTHTHSTRLPVVRLIPSHPPLSLSLSRVTCAGLWIAAAALCVSFCVSEREAQGCTPLRASRTLSQHTFTHAHAFIQTGGFHHPRHTVCCPAEHCDFRLREPDGEEGIFTQDPSMICNSMRSPCQTSFQGWVEHSRCSRRRGRNGSWREQNVELRAFLMSEDALCFTAGRFRVRWMLLCCSGLILCAVGEGM